MISKLADLIFPPKCVFCNTLIEGKSDDKVCLSCRQNLPYCMALGVGDIDGKSENFHFNRAVSAFVYEDFVANSIYRFKERGCRQYAKTYAKYLSHIIEHLYSGVSFDYIVTIPMTKARIAARGYDQTRLIAEHLSREISVPYLAGAMCKRRETEKQQGLSQDARKLNLTDVFEVVKAYEIDGKTLLLIDDVFTTGSTVDECAYTLVSTGAAAVYVATVAVTMKVK